MHVARINNESVTSSTDTLEKPVSPMGSVYDVRLEVGLSQVGVVQGSPEVFCACWDLKHRDSCLPSMPAGYFTFIWINRGNYSPANMGWEIRGKRTAIAVPTLMKSPELSGNFKFGIIDCAASKFNWRYFSFASIRGKLALKMTLLLETFAQHRLKSIHSNIGLGNSHFKDSSPNNDKICHYLFTVMLIQTCTVCWSFI